MLLCGLEGAYLREQLDEVLDDLEPTESTRDGTTPMATHGLDTKAKQGALPLKLVQFILKGEKEV